MIKRFSIISFVKNPHTPGCSLNWHLSSHIFCLKFVFFLFQIETWRTCNKLRWKFHYSKLWVFHILFLYENEAIRLNWRPNIGQRCTEFESLRTYFYLPFPLKTLESWLSISPCLGFLFLWPRFAFMLLVPLFLCPNLTSLLSSASLVF